MTRYKITISNDLIKWNVIEVKNTYVNDAGLFGKQKEWMEEFRIKIPSRILMKRSMERGRDGRIRILRYDPNPKPKKSKACNYFLPFERI